VKLSKKKNRPRRMQRLEDYLQKYNHCYVRVVLANGEILTGKIHTKARYDFKLNTEDGRKLIINKSALVYVEILKKEEGVDGSGNAREI